MQINLSVEDGRRRRSAAARQVLTLSPLTSPEVENSVPANV